MLGTALAIVRSRAGDSPPATIAGVAEPKDEAEGEEIPDIDELVIRLRARVAARRESGAYPPGLEEDMTAHFRRILDQRRMSRELPDIQGPVRVASEALPLSSGKIPLESGLPGGQAIHRAVARLVGRQTTGTLQQMQAFAQPVQVALEALMVAVEELNQTLHGDLAQSLDALYARQAAQERIMAGAGLSDRSHRTSGVRPWYWSKRFEETFRGSRETVLESYKELADRLVGCSPVLDVGCGRGEFLELLGSLGVEARGVDADGDLVKAAAGLGLDVKEDDAIHYLLGLDDGSLGAIVLVQVIEQFSAKEIVDIVAVAADKLRSGGRIFVKTVNPQPLYAFHALFLDPTHLRPVHPACLAFLFREAGFAAVDIEWGPAPPAEDVLEPDPADVPEACLQNENARHLNELMFVSRDYLIAAVR
jgi:2-polyprenyl-3-methyl-5-hydroxy-6-metoxy-1,4-benzoquinol methylase